MTPSSSAALVARALEGDELAFGRLVEPYRRELAAHCYRMLGSLHDAEDALQDALLRAWRGLAGFEAGRPIRPWLYRIATNACLDVIAARSKRVHDIEPCPDDALGLADGYAAPDARYEQRESVELAFVAALQHLPARQRAVLILRDVLGFSAREVAETMRTSTASANSALQRARAAVDDRLPARSQQSMLRALGDDGLRETVQRYVEAWSARDVDAIVKMLVEDATFAMPPHPQRFSGRDEVVAFIVATGKPRLRHFVRRVNGQPAVAWYAWRPQAGAYQPTSIEVLTLEGARVKDITAFVRPDLFPRLGLPPELPPDR